MDSECWVTFDSDRALQARIDRGYFGTKSDLYLPIRSFPAPPHGGSWTTILQGWCKSNGIRFVGQDLEISARVKKRRIEDFIDFVYGRDPSYFDPAEMLTWKGRAYLANALTDLRAFVAQQLNPRLWYELKADEF